MPIYEYECQACGHEFEKLVVNTSQEIVCPKCQDKDLKKLFSMFSGHSGGKSTSLGGGEAAGGACGSCTKKSCSSCG